MKKISLIILLASSVLCYAEKKDSILIAIQLYEFEQALQLIEESMVPEELTFYKVQALRALNRYPKAIEVLSRYLEKEPESQRAMIEIAECYRYTGNAHRAVHYYAKASGLNPENSFIQLQYINLLLQTEDFEKAKERSRELTGKGEIAGYRLSGQACEGLMETDSAIIHYKKAIEAQPNDYLSVALLANLLNNRNEFEEAIIYTESYRLTDSLNMSVNRQNAKAYCLSSNYPVAIERYRQLVEAGDRSFLTNYYLGVAYYAEDLFYEAQEYLDKAYKKEPKNTNLLYYLGRANAKTSWKKEGVEQLQLALEYTIPGDSTLAKLYRGLADCHKLAGQPREQVKALEKLYQYDPDAKSCLYSIGVIYHDRLKEYNNAIRYLEMFMKTRPDDLPESYMTEEGIAIITEDSYYKAAAARLKDLRKELFFLEGTNE